MPGCRKFDAASRSPVPSHRVELRRYVRRNVRPPRAANDNRRTGLPHAWYWVLVVGAMPTLGLIAALSALL